MKPHQLSIFPINVQFEDVDAHGVVHHPNYLKYIERARFYGMQQHGYSFETLLSSDSALTVSEIQANYLRPAFVGQALFVVSWVTAVGKSMLKLCQTITVSVPRFEDLELEKIKFSICKSPEAIFWADLKLICIDSKSLRPKSIPADLKRVILNGAERSCQY